MPLFLDGELDARQMREVALHSTRCGECEQELRSMEHLQDLIVRRVEEEIAQVDLGLVWANVGPRLAAARRPWHERLRERWDEIGPRWQTLAPVSAAAAAAAVLAVLLWQSQQPGVEPIRWASADNSANIESMQSNVESVALLREPETNTTVLWITDNEPLAGGALGDLP